MSLSAGAGACPFGVDAFSSAVASTFLSGAGASMFAALDAFLTATIGTFRSAAASSGSSLFGAVMSSSADTSTSPFIVCLSWSASAVASRSTYTDASWSAGASASPSTDIAGPFPSANASISLSADAAGACPSADSASAPLFLSISSHIPRLASVISRLFSPLNSLPDYFVFAMTTKTKSKLKE